MTDLQQISDAQQKAYKSKRPHGNNTKYYKVNDSLNEYYQIKDLKDKFKKDLLEHKSSINDKYNYLVEDIEDHKKIRRIHVEQYVSKAINVKKYDEASQIYADRLYTRLFRNLVKKLENSEISENQFLQLFEGYLERHLFEAWKKTKEIQTKIEEGKKINLQKYSEEKPIDMRKFSTLILRLRDSKQLFRRLEQRQNLVLNIKAILLATYYQLTKLDKRAIKALEHNAKNVRIASKMRHIKKHGKKSGRNKSGYVSKIEKNRSKKNRVELEKKRKERVDKKLVMRKGKQQSLPPLHSQSASQSLKETVREQVIRQLKQKENKEKSKSPSKPLSKSPSKSPSKPQSKLPSKPLQRRKRWADYSSSDNSDNSVNV